MQVSGVRVAADVIGVSEEAARSRVETDGLIWRVIGRDGVASPSTARTVVALSPGS